MRNPWIKSYHKEVVAQNKQEFVTFLEPQQLGGDVSSWGCQAGAQRKNEARAKSKLHLRQV